MCYVQADVGGPIVVMSSPGTWTLAAINSYTRGNFNVILIIFLLK